MLPHYAGWQAWQAVPDSTYDQMQYFAEYAAEYAINQQPPYVWGPSTWTITQGPNIGATWSNTQAGPAPAGALVPGQGLTGDWQCASCGNINFAFRENCNRCNKPRPGANLSASIAQNERRVCPFTVMMFRVPNHATEVQVAEALHEFGELAPGGVKFHRQGAKFKQRRVRIPPDGLALHAFCRFLLPQSALTALQRGEVLILGQLVQISPAFTRAASPADVNAMSFPIPSGVDGDIGTTHVQGSHSSGSNVEPTDDEKPTGPASIFMRVKLENKKAAEADPPPVSLSQASFNTGRPDVPESTIGGQTTCIVCFVNAKTHIAVPCGHQSVCGSCSAKIDKCPYCRTDVTMWMQQRLV